MKSGKVLLVVALALLTVSFGVVVSDLTDVAYAEDAGLNISGCVNCHLDAPRDIEEAGGAHKTDITCVDCHEGHPPLDLEIIPACSQCHNGSAHYELKACLSCHKNPHRPLEIILGKKLTVPCLTCHAGEGQQLKDFPSYHSTLDCTSCHAGTHGIVPECSDCHKPHSATMVEEDCHKCHQAHKPLDVTFTMDLPSTDCAGCHDQVFNVLSNSTAKHNVLTCVDCHETGHGNIPQCSQCHAPHSQDMTADKCKDCHQAHSPMPATFSSGIASAECGACHEEPLRTLNASQTKHQELQCLECHETTHGNIPQCNDCHEPHAEGMVQADCVSCHSAHRPLPVIYGEEVASKNCASCHEDADKLLQANKSKHHDLSCVVCHKTNHGTIPACQDCHGTPHPAQMLQKFPECGTCHNIAHDLL